MKKQLFSLMVISSLLSVTKPVLAADDNASMQNTAKMLQKMTTQAHALESQMKTLDSQIGELKAEQRELKAQVKTEKVTVVQEQVEENRTTQNGTGQRVVAQSSTT